MSRPLPLSAYLALRRGSAEADADVPTGGDARPSGPLVWIHVPDRPAATAAQAILGDFKAQDRQATLLLTGPGAVGVSGPDVIDTTLPTDTDAHAHAFLDHWQPNALVWVGGDLPPQLIDTTRHYKMARLLVCPGESAGLVAGSGFLLPGVIRALLALFDRVLCENRDEANRLLRAGAKPHRSEVIGRFEMLCPDQTVVESDYEDIAQTVGTRPIWVVAPAEPAELNAVIAAYQSAAHLAHRLLLVLVCDDPQAMAAHPELRNLNVADRSNGEDPGDLTEVLVVEQADQALFYRLAPMCFAGGTLSGGMVSDPFAAAAMGSAIIHGPQTGQHAAAFDRLDDAGAALAISLPQELGASVTSLLSVERTARFATTAWDVATAGAVATQRVSDLLQEALASQSAG